MKENKIEKLILDLSNRWECTPQEAVDRLNSMNESEINKLIKSMIKKFQMGGSLEDRVAFGTTERPRKFNPTEINPISKREAMQKYAGFGYDKGQLKRIYNRAAEHLGKENAAKWMSAAWDQSVPNQTGYLVPVEEQNTIWRNAPSMQSGPEMPITNSDPQYFNGPRNFKFKNGGIMKCLQGGKTYAECKKCGGKTPVVKNQEPAGPILPKYAKIIEGGGRNAEPRRIYYSDDKNNFEIEDGRLMSHEEVANPWGYWNNEAIKAGSQFGLRLPQVPVQYGPPVYSRYVQHPEVLNLQPADDIDHDKAAIETAEKIRKIRRK